MEMTRAREDEAEAVDALRGLSVLDSEPEAEFDAIVRAASVVCGTPISALSLIDADRQWFKAITGLPGFTETPRDVSFCAHVVCQDGCFEVPDATQDPRFADNPLVVGPPGIRFYAGAPVKLRDGTRIGSMCVIDRQPRQLDAPQREVLMCLADAAARAFEARRALLAMAKLAADAAQTNLVLEHSPDAIIAVSAEGRLLRWNPAAERLFGHAADEIVGQPIGVLAPAERADEDGEVLRRIADGRAHGYETVRVHRDGQRIDVSVTAVPRFDADGRLCGATEFVRDITASRRADTAVQQQTERLRLATDSAEIGVWEFDMARGTVEWNDWMYRLFGVAPDDGGQPGDLWSRHLHPDDAERMQVELTAALEGRGTYRPEFRVIWKSGEVRHLEAAAHITRDDTGNPLRMIGVNLDVTRQRRSEAELREAKKAAEAANEAKSAFLANMSHEIRTPMNAILGMLALLGKTEMTSRQADYAGKTESAARSLLGLLNDILDFSKVEAGKMALDSEPFDVEGLMSDLAVILSASVATKNLDVLFDIDPAVPPRLVGDAMRLRQVLINLGGNAVKFTADGEVVISITLRGRTADRVSLEFAVRDTGIGIAPENQARIFAGFTQAEASTTRRFGGTGLGLAISQRLVGLMGGELRLDSALGRGTRFYFGIDLPVAADCISWVAPPVAPRVLIVDDNPTARGVLARAARSLGWTTEVAASGEQALEHIRDAARAGHRFDAVFTDWRMPGLDGWQTLRLIRDEPVDGPAPLLLMVTANSREALLQRSAGEQGLIAGFLVKPVTASMLAAALNEARQGPAASAPVTPGARRLAGLRLLVVEDNANNQQVARELLEDEGAVVQIAADGQVAVDALAAPGHGFDIVLMDLQMPVMDGFTATAKIRQELGLKELPIIAMTANAMDSDREACLAAGMNAHVGKPFDLSGLVAVLLLHAGRAAAPAGARPTQGALPAELLDVAAGRGIELAAAVDRMGGNSRVYLRTLKTFAEDLPPLPDQLLELLQQGRMTEAGHLVHTIKGLAATLGIRALARLAAEIEPTLHVIDPLMPQNPWAATLRATVEAATQGVAHVVAAFDQYLPLPTPAPDWRENAAAEAPEDMAALSRSLDELIALLRQADMGALEVLERLQQAHSERIRDALQPLDHAMAALDFDLAAERCRALKEKLAP
jgi:PAS domain S-box-containing protein